MNEYLSGFILGLVQGLTEFLPVSSSGHLMLLEYLGVGKPSLQLNLLLHLATLLAVFVVFFKKIKYLVLHPFDSRVKLILFATIPTGIIAALVRYIVPQNINFLPFCFVFTSVILILPKIIKPKENDLGNKFYLKSAFVGVAQGIACLNGISRSGSTVTALRLCGVSAEESAELSFLLSIPVIIGSTVVEVLTSKSASGFSGGIIIGMVTAFVVGIVAIKGFMALIKKDKIAWFSLYTILLAILSFFAIQNM